MENASKALIMAGGVLISLMIIGILVFFFNNFRDLQGINQDVETTKQITEFNKQYDAYARNVYGSELLSLANKIEDYNKRESELKGYAAIALEVNITKNIDDEFFTIGIYNSNDIEEKIKTIKDKIKSIGMISVKIKPTGSRKVSQLASMRTKDIEDLGIDLESEIKDDENKKYKVNEAITKYNTLKTLLTEIKSKPFKFNGFEYDDYNGRITKMKYQI